MCELIEDLQLAIAKATDFIAGYGVGLDQLRRAAEREFIKRRDDAVNALLIDDEVKNKGLDFARVVNRVFRAILPDERASEFGPARAILVNIAELIKSLTATADFSELMAGVEQLIDASIDTQGYVIPEVTVVYRSRLK